MGHSVIEIYNKLHEVTGLMARKWSMAQASDYRDWAATLSRVVMTLERLAEEKEKA